MNARLRIGISPCPNDTFAFHGLLERRTEAFGLDLAIELADVEELNRRFARGDLDAAKCSFHAALPLSRWAVVLPAGAALGFGVGPLVLARSPRAAGSAVAEDARVLSPGVGTTADLLFRLFHPRAVRIEPVRFSEILPRLARGEADLGVCIHEARFTYARYGLAPVEDLGDTWERATGLPLPLGGILARKDLGPEVLGNLTRAIRTSLAHARTHREEALMTMRRHAQELDEPVIWQHVELYVNDHTVDLGPEAALALEKLRSMAVAAGRVPPDAPPLDVARQAP